MSQFTPPADPPPGAMETSAAMHGPKPWSALAISGFVLSILGCLGITAALGLVFGVAGIVATRRGGKRGFLLAAVAIPISIVTGTIGVGGYYVAKTMSDAMLDCTSAVVGVVGSAPDESAEALAAFREFCSEEFIEKISDESLSLWLTKIREKHGSLVSTQPLPTPLEGGKALQINAKFVNGPAPIVFRYAPLSWRKMLINYVDVDGLTLGQSP